MRGDPITRRKTRSLSKQHLRLWLQMLRATGHVETAVRERLRDTFGTTLPRFDVMAALFRAPDGLTMTKLSRELKVSNGNVTGIVDRLAEQGLVSREPGSEDRRIIQLKATDKGRTLLTSLIETQTSITIKIMEHMSVEDLAALLKGMNGLIKAIGEYQGKL